jgi:hypothetical protein
MSAIMGSYTAFLPLMGSDNVQITTMFSYFDGPGALGNEPNPGLFQPMGGPGSFTWCPGGLTVLSMAATPAATCPAAGPPQGAGTRNGRVIYTGGSGFGGVSQMLLGGGGLVTRPGAAPHDFGSTPFWAGQEPFGGGAATQYQVIGADWINKGMQHAAIDINFLNGATYTNPKTAPTSSGYITSAQFGPGVTAAGGLTACPTTGGGTASTASPPLSTKQFANIPLTGGLACVKGSGALKAAGAGTSTNTGFPFSAATVFAQQSTAFSPDAFTVTGYDARSPKGLGKIVLVAGGLTLRTNQGGTNPGAGIDTISLTLSEKTPSMSAGGFAAAAVLMVLAAGYAMRRRY